MVPGGPMKITELDALAILFPERRDPETERRRLATLARGRELFPDELLTPEHLKRGIPLPARRQR